MLFSFSLLLVTSLVLLIQWSIGRGMIDYVNNKEQQALDPLIVALVSEYKEYDSWHGLADEPRYFGDLIYEKLKGTAFLPPPPNRGPRGRDRDRPPRPDFSASDRERPEQRRPPRRVTHAGYILLDSNKDIVVGAYVDDVDYNAINIEVDSHRVGWLLIPKRNKVTDGYELDFIQQQQSSLWLIAVLTMLLVTLVSSLLAKHLSEPIKMIKGGMHKLTQGDYKQKIILKRGDELGELSRDFNELAVTLHENENARKRWLANISHELRTPIAILRGELEAVLDGVRPLHQHSIESANDEVKHLQHLIDDLHQLTTADIGGMSYRKHDLNFNQWLESEAKKYQSFVAAAQMTLLVDVSEQPVTIYADATRLCQLFKNLLSNCVKYSEASKIKITSKLDTKKENLQICVEDDGVGVADEHLTNLFEYLYRVENSRNRKTGGSGLGLSICAHIVSGHQGQIRAENSVLGGLAIVIKLPLKTQ